MFPESRLVLSGGSAFDPRSDAEVMADVASALGIRREDMILEPVSRDTQEEARLIQGIIGDDRFVLVTSAAHMPRSMVMFEALGMRPLPAPTDHEVKSSSRVSPGMFFPNPENILKATKALHEYLGLAWLRISGWVWTRREQEIGLDVDSGT